VVLLNLATAHLQLERPEAAAALGCCETALKLRAHFPMAWHNRGVAQLRLGEFGAALASFDGALAQQKDFLDAHLGRAEALQGLGQLPSALQACDAVLTLRPTHAAALRLRALILLAARRATEALADLDRLDTQPDAAYWVLRGNVLFTLQRTAEARACYAQALQLAPRDIGAHFNLGNLHLHAGELNAALGCYDTTLALDRHHAKAHYYRGESLRRMRHHRPALESYRRAVDLDPSQAQFHCGIGDALRVMDRLDEALAAYGVALELDPQCVDALSHSGRIMLFRNQPAAASELLERLMRAAPESGPAHNYALGMLYYCRMLRAEWRDQAALRATLLAGVTQGRSVALPSLFLAASDDPGAQQRCAALFAEANWPTPPPADSLSRASPAGASPAGPIRLAYVSADFREHPVAQLLVRLIELHDRQRFEVYGIALRPADASDLGTRISGAFDHFLDVSEMSDAAIADRLRQLNIDIAVDLNGYTDGCRPGIFAQRCAPAQVSYLGYAGTMGTRFMDYLIADPWTIPEAQRGHYSERVLHLPRCLLPRDDRASPPLTTATRRECELPEAGFVFCCFNGQYKITPQVFAVWMRLLRELEHSVLWLAARDEAVRANLRQAASSSGVDGARLVFADRLADPAAHLARYHCADLFLDTLPLNGHTTVSDALWMGLPVLTCQGQALAGRIAGSLLASGGMDELIADNLEDYAQRALELARHPTRLRTIRSRLSAPAWRARLFAAERYCRDLEDAYQQIAGRTAPAAAH
jgi:protein O-GlcNAc transferase